MNRLDGLSEDALWTQLLQLESELQELKNRQRVSFTNNLPMYFAETVNFTIEKTSYGFEHVRSVFYFIADNQLHPMLRAFLEVRHNTVDGPLWVPGDGSNVYVAGHTLFVASHRENDATEADVAFLLNYVTIDIVFQAAGTVHCKLDILATDTGEVQLYG